MPRVPVSRFDWILFFALFPGKICVFRVPEEPSADPISSAPLVVNLFQRGLNINSFCEFRNGEAFHDLLFSLLFILIQTPSQGRQERDACFVVLIVVIVVDAVPVDQNGGRKQEFHP
jgi:hypothetical protein